MKLHVRSIAGLVLSTGLLFGATSVALPSIAGADATQAATTVVVSSPSAAPTTGHRIRFTALVSSATAGSLAGTMTWTITDSKGTSYSCEHVTPVRANGTAACEFAPGQLLGAVAPFSVTAAYSGNATFAGSTSAPFAQGVSPGNTQMRLLVSPVSSGASATITAILSSPNANALLSGQVTFAVISSQGTVRPTCTNNDISTNPNRNLAVPVTSQTVTCVLPAGWIVLPAPSADGRQRPAYWSVAATFSDAAAGSSFNSITHMKRGRIQS